MSEQTRLRTWSDGDERAEYVLMPAEQSSEDITIVADPDALSNVHRSDEDDSTLADDIDEDEFEEYDLEGGAHSPLSGDSSSTSKKGAPPSGPGAESKTRAMLVRVVNSIWWQGIVFLIIVLDIVLLILQLYAYYDNSPEAKKLNAKFGEKGSLTILAIVVVTILLVEVLLRLAVLGKYFWKSKLNIFDLIVMVVSFILMVAVINLVAGGVIILLRVIRIATRVVRVAIKVVQGKRNLNQAVRNVVTENKMRYTKDGWDLDLAYITDRVMVMSLPAWDFRSLYRNNIDDVARFLDTMHPDKYIVLNCCAESYANYPVSKFHDRVKRYYIDDHNTAPLGQMLEACEYVDKWMRERPDNVVVIHCKGGKGRSGSMICAYLLYYGVCHSGVEVMDLFAHKRTDPTKPGRLQGVETASQRRYVEYFSNVVRSGKILPPPTRLYITNVSVKLISPDKLQGTYQMAPFASITHNDGVPTTSLRLRKRHDDYDSLGGVSVDYEGPKGVTLVNDVRLMIFLEDKKGNQKGKKREIYFFYFWFHTAFVGSSLTLSKPEVDRNRKWKKSPFGKLKSLTVQVSFAPV